MEEVTKNHQPTKFACYVFDTQLQIAQFQLSKLKNCDGSTQLAEISLLSDDQITFTLNTDH